jgi:transposase
MAVRRVADLFRVSVSYIYKALLRRRRTGEAKASARRGHRPRKLNPAQEAALAARIEAQPDLTLAALQAWLLAEHSIRLSNGAMWSAVGRLGLSYKKRRCGRASRTVLTLRHDAGSGRQHGPLSILTSSSLSTRPAPAPR